MISVHLIKKGLFSLYLYAFEKALLENSFHIDPTADTPGVIYSPKDAVFEISGRSLPENAYAFFEQLILWAEKFDPALLNQNLVLRFKLDYFNSASGRYLLEFLATLEKRFNDASQARIEWYVDKEDELMIEKGEEFGHLLDFPLEIKYLH
jgi:hypothetical protein